MVLVLAKPDQSSNTGERVCVCVGVCLPAHVLTPYLVLIVQQLSELGDGAGGQLSIVLVVDQVNNGRLEQL